MTMISLTLPMELAKTSQAIAKDMCISRAQFIRMALEHEIAAYHLRQEQKAIVSAFKNMKKHPSYFKEADLWMDDAPHDLRHEDDWWKT